MSNTKEYFKQLEATLAVKELDNETAAAIQGGYELEVYRHANLVDLLGEFNYGKDGLSSNADNQISSVRVNSGRWRLYEYANYLGRYVEVGVGDWNMPSSLNDKISSIRQVSG